MFSPNHPWSRVLLIILNVSFIVLPARAQFWHVLPSVSDSDAISAGFSNDQKKVFFIRRDNGVANVWSTVIMDKYGGIIASPNTIPTQVTKFTDRGVVRFFHLLNRPEILFMRATDNGKDFHIYRIKDDGSEQPQDLTPGGDGVTNIIIGASYNGRYVYYTNNAVHHDKVDCYRYDTQQFTSDLIFPNDKDYQVIAWTRDQTKLLVEDPSANILIYYDIETTERTPLQVDSSRKIGYVNLNPSTLQIEVDYFDAKKGLHPTDYSPNCKYQIYDASGRWTVSDVATHNIEIPLPQGARPIAIAPKETLLVYLNGSKLYLYDIAKNNSTELSSVR
jgi:hypothetical protein